MTRFRKGELVHIEFDGEIYADPGTSTWISVVDNNHYFIHHLWASTAEEIITRVDPVYWPPQVGDIWEANGCEFVVRTSLAETDKVFIESLDGSPPKPVMFSYPSAKMEDFKKLNPRLIRRRSCE